MKLLVCINKTPDTTARISFADEETRYDTSGIQFIMNPYDEWYALVRALELKEAHGGTITVVHVGSMDSETIIRKALAIGADDAIRINKEPIGAFDIAHQIAAVAKDQSYDIIFLGKESIDYNSAEVGPMLAELLDMPFVAYANHLETNGQQAIASRDIEGGVETAIIPMPLIISASKGLAEQRIPNMRGIMMAKSKPLQVLEPIETTDHVEVVRFEMPEQRTTCHLVDPDNMEELVELLHTEAKVI